jgi:hypothetical protein
VDDERGVAGRERGQRHAHVGLDVARGEDDRAVADDLLQVRLGVLEDERDRAARGEGGEEAHDVRVAELAEQRELAERRHVHALARLADAHLLDGHDLARLRTFSGGEGGRSERGAAAGRRSGRRRSGAAAGARACLWTAL